MDYHQLGGLSTKLILYPEHQFQIDPHTEVIPRRQRNFKGTTGMVVEWERPKVAKGPRFETPPNPDGTTYLAKNKKKGTSKAG